MKKILILAITFTLFSCDKKSEDIENTSIKNSQNVIECENSDNPLEQCKL